MARTKAVTKGQRAILQRFIRLWVKDLKKEGKTIRRAIADINAEGKIRIYPEKLYLMSSGNMGDYNTFFFVEVLAGYVGKDITDYIAVPNYCDPVVISENLPQNSEE